MVMPCREEYWIMIVSECDMMCCDVWTMWMESFGEEVQSAYPVGCVQRAFGGMFI